MPGKFLKSGVGFRALLFSIVFHCILFLGFAYFRVSGGDLLASRQDPAMVTVTQIDQAISNSPVIPKPAFKKIEIGDGAGKMALEIDASDSKISLSADPEPEKFSGQLESDLFAGQFDSDPLTEFFGSSTNLRKICYVVDASGSMQGRLGMVSRQLKQSISKLKPDQYFYVIFFRGDRIVESGNGILSRATRKSKSAAYKFVDSIQFEGGTNAINAITRAMRIKDPSGRCVEQIYFLSDGFDLKSEFMPDFAGMIQNMRKRLAPSVRINTIGVWVEQKDQNVLRAIAASSGGQYVGLK